MFTPCNNAASCSRAGWCKRISYKQFTPEDRKNAKFFECGPENGWHYYVKNKAREIYEREHPNDILQNEEHEQQQYDNPDREPGLREDNVPDSGPGEENQGGPTTDFDRVLELFQCGGGRSSTESGTSVDIDGLLRALAEEPQYIDYRDAYSRLDGYQTPELQNNALPRIPTPEPSTGEPHLRLKSRRIWEDDWNDI